MKTKVKIGDDYYTADTSAITALRYRAWFNKSILTSGFTEDDALDVLYVSVSDVFDYDNFREYALDMKYAKDMCISAGGVLEGVMKDSGVKREVIQKADERMKDDGNTIFDEFTIISVITNIGLSFDLMKEVSLMQLMYITAQTYEMKYGKDKDGVKITKMSQEERKQIYSITKEDEDRIREYLNKKKVD